MSGIVRRAKRYFQQVTKTALGTKNAGRGVTVLPDDIFIVGYFRSGSTWSRFLFGNFIHQQEAVTFANLDRLVPSIYAVPDRILRRGHRILKSHECFDPRYPRTIHIVRDPRDIAVSFYYYLLKVRHYPDGFPMEQFVDQLIAGRTGSYADRIGTWELHTLSWTRLLQGKDNYRLVRYEDLLSDTAGELRKVAPLLRIEPTEERVQRAIDLSSASHMRSLEGKESKQWKTTKNTRKDLPFVREAKSGGWRGKLPEASVRKIEQAWGATMLELGYELAYPDLVDTSGQHTVKMPVGGL